MRVEWDQGPNAADWSTAVERWRGYIRRTEGTSLRFDRTDGGGAAHYSDRSHRWSPGYREEYYAKLKDMERGIEDFYGTYSTGMLSLTASSERGDGPVDVLHDLCEGRTAVLQALRRALDGRTWDYWWVMEPHDSGYPHLHVAIVVRGSLDPAVLRPAVDAHLRAVPGAGEAAHESAITVRRGSEIRNTAAYLNSYLGGGYGTDALDLPPEQQALAACLWATGRRHLGASARLREWMAGEEPSSPHEWQLTAIVDGDGEERPLDPELPGRVARFDTEISYG